MLGCERLLYFHPRIVLFPMPPPLCSSPSVLLFRIDLVDGFVKPCVELIGKGGPNLLVPSGLFESIILCPCVLDFDFVFDALDCEEATSSLL